MEEERSSQMTKVEEKKDPNEGRTGPTSSSSTFSDLSNVLTPQEGDYYLASNWVWYYSYVTRESLEEDEKRKKLAKDASDKETAGKKKELKSEKDDSKQEVENKDKDDKSEDNKNNVIDPEKAKDNDPTVSNTSSQKITSSPSSTIISTLMNNTTTTSSSSTTTTNQKQEADWDSNLALASFSTINGFWSIYNKVMTPSLCPTGKEGKLRYYVFREGIEPKFESPVNKGGGYWQIYTYYVETMDQYWEDLLLSMIGESLEQSVYTEEELATMARREAEEGIRWADQIDRFIHGLEIHTDRNRVLIWTKQADRQDRVERLASFIYNLCGGKKTKPNAFYFTFEVASRGEKLTKVNASYKLLGTGECHKS